MDQSPIQNENVQISSFSWNQLIAQSNKKKIQQIDSQLTQAKQELMNEKSPSIQRLVQAARKAKDMGQDIMDLVSDFTNQASQNTQTQNLQNLKQLQDLKNEMDRSLKAAGRQITNKKRAIKENKNENIQASGSAQNVIEEIDKQLQRLERIEKVANNKKNRNSEIVDEEEAIGIKKKKLLKKKQELNTESITSEISNLQSMLGKVKNAGQQAGLLDSLAPDIENQINNIENQIKSSMQSNQQENTDTDLNQKSDLYQKVNMMEKRLKQLLKSESDKQFIENDKLEHEQQNEKVKIKFLENKIDEMSQQLNQYQDIISESLVMKNRIQPQITQFEKRISLLESRLIGKYKNKVIDIDEETQNISPIHKVSKQEEFSEEDNIRNKLQHLADQMEKINKMKQQNNLMQVNRKAQSDFEKINKVQKSVENIKQILNAGEDTNLLGIQKIEDVKSQQLTKETVHQPTHEFTLVAGKFNSTI